MATICPWCKSADVGAGFDGFQCFSCGGFMKHDGTPTVPTSALETEGATYSGPGAELIADPETPPYQARNPVK